MIIYIILFLTIGLLFGIFTGLCPGVHINLVSTLLLSLIPLISNTIDPLYIVLIIIGMSITHTFLDFIPSVYLGAPNEDSAATILPAHKMLINGKGYEAVKYSILGAFTGLILTALLISTIINLSKNYYQLLQQYIPFILILSIILILIKEEGSKINAILVILLSGSLGLLVLNLSTLTNPLFPLLSGLFGISTLIISLNEKTVIPKQEIQEETKFNKRELSKVTFTSFITSIISGFIPGISSSQSAIVSSSFLKNIEPKSFIFMSGLIGTSTMIISFAALYSINKARNGAVVVISKIIENITLNNIFLFVSCSIFIGGLAFIISLKISKKFSVFITKINYQKISLAIIITITILVMILTGFIGLLVLTVSTAIGLLPQLLKVGKNHSMACLIIPVLLFLIL
jgi:putative membrane protein